MTEDQARHHRCPVVKQNLVGYEGNSFESAGYCLASECMIWRWDKTTEDDQQLAKLGRTEYPGLPKDQWEGYCGLGGKP